MIRLLCSLLMLIVVTGCARQAVKTSQDPLIRQPGPESVLARFSANRPGGLPQGWEPLILLRNKNPTRYQLVQEDGAVVLHARAERASSGLIHHLDIDPYQYPWLQWQWKIDRLIATADNSRREAEDAPVRIVLGFDGDKSELPFLDQLLFETARAITGYEFPYATLMYIWANKAEVDSVIRSPHSSRVRMIAVERGEDGVHQWRTFRRNIVEDFEKAFGEKPGRLIGIGVLTDTDNTGETVDAWYGDIDLLPQREMLAEQ